MAPTSTERVAAGRAAPDRGGAERVGPDGRARCDWAEGDALLRRYHDEEWGRPPTGDADAREAALFEGLSLEGWQCGLSWLLVLRRRPALRRTFHGFAPERVAALGSADVDRLLAVDGMIRNRAKVVATIGNARALLAMADTSLSALVAAHAPSRSGVVPAPRTAVDVPAATPGSAALAGELRARGFRFVGPITVYSLMQACGVVDDHVARCFVRAGWEGTGAR